MARRFRGKSVHKVDAKGRVSVPASFRRVLEEGDPDWRSGENPQLILVHGSNDGRCLEGYSIKSMEKMDDMVEELPYFSPQRDYYETMLESDSDQLSVDENGRMVLATHLREMIGVSREAIFVGKGNRFQIWEPAAYEAERERIAGWGAEQQNPYALFNQTKTGD